MICWEVQHDMITVVTGPARQEFRDQEGDRNHEFAAHRVVNASDGSAHVRVGAGRNRRADWRMLQHVHGDHPDMRYSLSAALEFSTGLSGDFLR